MKYTITNILSFLKTIGILALGLIFQPSNAQNALDFDGTDDKVDCGNDTSVQITGNKITLEAWIYPTAWKTNAYDGNVICKEDNKSNFGYMLRVGAGGRLNFAIGDSKWQEITTGVLLSLNKWQHIAGTYDGTKMRVYIDGVAVDSLSVATSIQNASSTNLLLGAHSSYTRFYQGMIDEVKIWNIWRSESDIAKGMYDEVCSRQKGMRAYYKFNQGKAGSPNFSVKSLTDFSGFSNTGTLTAFTLSGSASNWLKGMALKKSASHVSDTVVACDRFTAPSGRRWTVSGVYKDTLPTFMGCDSVLTYYLTIKKSTSKTISAHACKSYVSPSGLYTWTQSGTYKDYLLNSVKCDSVITVVLKIGGGRDTIYPQVCNAYTVPSGKATYTKSGFYNDTLVDYRGCDSILGIDLTILTPTTSTIQRKACSSFTSPSGKYTWTKKGIYLDTIANYRGCDSFITVNLNILKGSSTINKTVCYKYSSPSGKYVWTKSGTYYDTLYNYAFCDSVITVNLTVNTTTLGTMDVKSCAPMKSPSKKYVWSKSGVYHDTIPNKAGCDSAIAVNLNIPKINVAVQQSGNTLTALSPQGSFQWLNCSKSMEKVAGQTSSVFTATVNGSYAVEVADSGCMDTSKCFAITSAAIASIDLSHSFSIQPNPNKGTFDLVLPNNYAHAVVLIRDMSGRIVFEKSFENLQQSTLYLNEKPGIYLVELKTENARGTRYLCIE